MTRSLSESSIEHGSLGGVAFWYASFPFFLFCLGSCYVLLSGPYRGSMPLHVGNAHGIPIHVQSIPHVRL